MRLPTAAAVAESSLSELVDQFRRVYERLGFETDAFAKPLAE